MKQSMLPRRNGLLRGACHRAHSRDPLARNDKWRVTALAYLHGLESLTSNFPNAPEMTKSL
jgi:hypothetical protein